MRIRHPSDYCLNCNHKISRNINYCPNCGQENTDYKFAVWHLIIESINNYLNLDSQFFRSIYPFLFRPGHLTIKFIEGRRKLFINPIRLYIIISIIFFFLFSNAIDIDDSSLQLMNEEEIDEAFNKYVLSDSTKNLNELIEEMKRSGSISSNSKDTINNFFSKENKLKLLSKSFDTLSLDNSTLFGVSYKYNQNKVYYVWMRQPDMTPDAFLDSLNASEKNIWNRRLASQMLKIGQTSNPKVIINEVLENISVMFFILIPFFAFLLKIFYLGKRKLYYNHLIFSLHLHTYLFFLAAVFIGISFFNDDVIALAVYGTCTFLIYVLLMFRRVYKDRWFKIIIKTFFLFTIYLNVISIFSVFEVLASFLIF